MEGDNVAVLVANVEGVQVIEEGPRVCPLCSSQIKLFFINYNEKLLMCENTECEFPFGYEDLQFVQVDNADNETGSVKTRQNFFSQPQSSTSVISVSDIDRLCKAYDSEDQSDTTSVNVFARPPKRSYSREHRLKIEKNVEDLKNLSIELVKVSNETKIKNKTIQDQKMIRNLYNLQDVSGIKLLKPQELEILKKDEAMRQPEVKIDINRGNDDDISVIKIELISNDESSNDNQGVDETK